MNRITYKDFRQKSLNLSYGLYNIIQAIGTVAGIIAWSLLDVALGGILYSLAFKDVSMSFLGIAPLGIVLGWSLSVSLWFIQITVWRYIQETRGFDWKDRKIVMAVFIAVALGLLDTLGDNSPIVLFVHNSQVVGQAHSIPFLGTTLGKLISNSILGITILLTGFGEPLNALIFRNANPVMFESKPRTAVTKQKPTEGIPFKNVGQGRIINPPFGGRK